MEVPTLERPDITQIFYINTNWSKYGMGELLMKKYESVEEIKSQSQEKADVKCEFYKYM